MRLAKLLLCAFPLMTANLALAVESGGPTAAVQQIFKRFDKTIDGDWKRTPLTTVLASLSQSEGIPISIEPQSAERGKLVISVHAAANRWGPSSTASPVVPVWISGSPAAVWWC
jgi:hypothetical protein